MEQGPLWSLSCCFSNVHACRICSSAEWTKTLAKTNKLSKKTKRGWYTKEQMSKRPIEWSSQLGYYI